MYDVCVCVCLCVPVMRWSLIWHTRWRLQYMKENEALAIGNSHIKAVLHYGMAMAVVLHLIALDYSYNCIACGHLHVYAITVILNIPQLYYCQCWHPNFLAWIQTWTFLWPLFYNAPNRLDFKIGVQTQNIIASLVQPWAWRWCASWGEIQISNQGKSESQFNTRMRYQFQCEVHINSHCLTN